MNYLAFFSDFHPVAVHFPIALIPTVVLLILYRQWRPDQVSLSVIQGMLWLTLACCVIAVALGMGNRTFNGHSGEAVDAHAQLGFITTILICLIAVHYSFPAVTRRTGRAISRAITYVWSALHWSIRAIWRIVWGVVRFLLLPLRALWWLVRKAFPSLAVIQSQVRHFIHARFHQLANRVRHWALLLRPREHAATGIALLACLVLIAMTGLKGANLSHGEEHLTRNMPQTLQALLGIEQDQTASQLDQDFFEQEVQPALQRSCVKCHGEHKQKKGLRLDSYTAVIASGVVRYQNPQGSELLRRILLPHTDPGVMPPPEKGRPLQSDDISIIIQWLQGKSLQSLAMSDAGLPDDIRSVARHMPPISTQKIDALNTIAGLTVRRLVDNVDLVVATLSYVPADRRDEAISQLRGIASHIYELDMSGLSLSERQWNFVQQCDALRRLNLARTNISSSQLKQFQALRDLQWLNLYDAKAMLPEADIRSIFPNLVELYIASSTSR